MAESKEKQMIMEDYPEYIKRMFKESDELFEKIQKAEAEKQVISFGICDNPNVDKTRLRLLVKQLEFMREYSRVLTERINHECWVCGIFEEEE